MSITEAGRSRDCVLDRLDELAGPLEGMLAPPTSDRAGNLLRVALLAVLAEDVRQLALGGLVDEVAGGIVGGGIHAHVERRVGCIGEAPLRPVDLHRRNA